jgi:phosphopantothenoylcysteine decarboxylase / phosphopantothenate---cysteine ligase
MALIALGVTGGIGAYKAVEVCRGLQKRGHDVVAVMTRSATRFVGPLTFEAITRHPVITSQFGSRPDAGSSSRDIEHIAIADRAALLLVAPCTANVLAKFAHGLADDFLSSLFLATKAPVLLAPAMNTNMLAHPAVQQNLRILAGRGVRFVEPGEGYLACGWMGKGRLAEPEDIVEAAVRVLAPVESRLRGRRVLITAGPTYEDIDPVRYVGNRSSGRMGFALAEEALRRGADVTLVAGPTSVPVPAVQQVVRVRSAAEMHEAVMARAAEADVVIMAAAVADYTPQATASQKVPKGDGPLSLTLTRTRDILAELGGIRSAMGGRRPVLVGFAAETDDLVRKARDKRARKGVDLMVANDVSRPDRGFDSPSNAVTLVAEGSETAVPLRAKSGVASAILDAVEPLVGQLAPAVTRE